MGRVNFARWVMLGVLLGAWPLLGAGCGKKNPIDGTYQDSGGMTKYYFHSGDCDVTFAGITREYTYALSGNTVTIKPKKGVNSITFKIQPNGSLLETATGDTLTKSK